MGEKSTKSHKLAFLYGVIAFNIVLTLSAVSYLGYLVHSLNNRVVVLEESLTQAESSKTGKRFVRSLSKENPMRSCEQCERVCGSILRMSESKVRQAWKGLNFNLSVFCLCL